MNRLVALVLMGLSTLAVADDVNVVHTQPAVEHYTYTTDLDIAKVISVTPIEKVCGVVPAHMVYEDHQGEQHILEYRIMGEGCSNG